MKVKRVTARENFRKNREKYLLDIEPQARLNQVYVALMAAAGVLASVAFLVNSIPILIGSMVIAPVMPPLILMAVGLANGKIKTVLKGCVITAAGLFVALLFTMATTWILGVTGVSSEQLKMSSMLKERIAPGWYSVAAAAAAGVAGALAISHKKQDTLVGVVASVALVPTVAASGIAGMTGDWRGTLGGLAMLGLNVSMIVGISWIVFNFLDADSE